MPKDAKIKVPGSSVLLTPRQELFCHEFLKDLNARLAELKAEQTKRTKIEADDILRRLVRISEKTEQEGDYNAAIRSLELLGKHQAMWTDKSINETTVKNAFATGNSEEDMQRDIDRLKKIAAPKLKLVENE